MTAVKGNRFTMQRAAGPRRDALCSGPALAVGFLAASLLAACGSSSPTGGGTSGASATAGAGPAGAGPSAGSANVGGAGSPAGGSGVGGSAGNDSVAGSSTGGASESGAGGASAGAGGPSAGAGGASAGAGGASAGAGGLSSGGGSTGCPAGAAFCDNFDASANLAAAWTTDNTLGATLKVVSTFSTTPGPMTAHSGTNAVQISFTTGTGYAMIVSKMGVPAASSSSGFWARAWLYIETPTSDTGHDVYIEGSTGMSLSNNGARPLNTQGGKMEINIDPVNGSEASASTTTAIPRGAWTCFEWQVSATGANGDISLYVAGATAPVASLKAKPIQALTEQRIGYERYAAGTAGTLWIDDYAIGSARLGCN